MVTDEVVVPDVVTAEMTGGPAWAAVANILFVDVEDVPAEFAETTSKS